MANRGEPESIPPVPGDLIASIRGFGYTLQTALADLVDNSLTAEAKRVEITIDAISKNPAIWVSDDGKGMSEETLREAMRFGTKGPVAERSATDLGRFGLGLKTASLSHGKSLTVITRRAKQAPVFRRWDLNYIASTGGWTLCPELTARGEQLRDAVGESRHGTIVLIEKLDRASFLEVPNARRLSHLAITLEAIRAHLGMVFHRFIAEDNVVLRLGETAIPEWDPFLVGKSKRLPSEKLQGRSGAVEVTPYVLPHHSRLSEDEHQRAGGPLGWNKHQGFFVYRCRRLIVPGDWLNLKLKQEEHYKLARIQLDLPNPVDDEWHLNVVKSQVTAPSLLREDLRRIADDVRREASAIYRVRGERQAPSSSAAVHPVWRRKETPCGVRFIVDRTHPMVRSLLHSGCDHDICLAEFVRIVGDTIPVAAILQEPVKSLDGVPVESSEEEIHGLAVIAQHSILHFVRTGKSPAEARRIVLGAEPFAQWKDRISALLERSNA